MNRGTTSWTDGGYTVTGTGSDEFVEYGVKAYFSVNGVWSDPGTSVVWATQGIEPKAGSEQTGTVSITSDLPTEFAIGSYPNPFNPSTTISYQLVEDARVSLIVYDMIGREVVSLLQGEKSAGYHAAQWNGRDASNNPAASGVYLYRFTAHPTKGTQSIVRSGKLILSK